MDFAEIAIVEVCRFMSMMQIKFSFKRGCKSLVCDYGSADPLPPQQHQINYEWGNTLTKPFRKKELGPLELLVPRGIVPIYRFSSSASCCKFPQGSINPQFLPLSSPDRPASAELYSGSLRHIRTAALEPDFGRLPSSFLLEVQIKVFAYKNTV
eukprot:g6702.t1